METIDFAWLDVFIAVADTSSFSGAGTRLGMPKASVSRAVARLEAALGQQLFYRTTRRVTLTKAGAALQKRASPSIAALRQVVAVFAAQQEEVSGVLRVTAPNDLGTSFLAEVAAEFCARHPAVRLDLELTSRHVDLVAEGFDVALRASARLADSSLVARKLADVPMYLVAAPAYVARRGLPRSARDLDGHDLVQFTPFRGALRLRAGGRTVACRPSVRMVADDLGFVREAARAGAGIGLLPGFLARADLAGGTLVRLLPRYELPHAALYLLHPAARHVPPKVIAFRDTVIGWLASHPIGRGAAGEG
ncbi:MAG TPA: LysR family transcriptional regulator [Candidatus Binatia bacterium]